MRFLDVDRGQLKSLEHSQIISERYVRNDFRRDPNVLSSSKTLKEETQLQDPMETSTMMDSRAKRTSEESKENSKSDSDSSETRKNKDQRNSQDQEENKDDTVKSSKFHYSIKRIILTKSFTWSNLFRQQSNNQKQLLFNNNKYSHGMVEDSLK